MVVVLTTLGFTEFKLGLGFQELISDLAPLFSTLIPIDFLFLDFVDGNDGNLAVVKEGFEVCNDIWNLGAAGLESGFLIISTFYIFVHRRDNKGAIYMNFIKYQLYLYN